MITKELQEKINKSYEVLKMGGVINKTYYHAPLIITYSGGKDSDVMLQLARECMNPDDFEVVNSHTTVDAPQTVYHIREVFKELNQAGIKTTIHNLPTKDQTQKTMWDLCLKHGMVPTRKIRFCCKELKEASTPNRIAATGVRSSESNGRKGRDAFSTQGKTKADAHHFSLEHVREVFAEAVEDAREQKIPLETKSPWDCTFIRNAKENKNEIVNPIYEWSNSDVWEYIRDRGIKYCELYDMGYSRVGCIGCPLGGSKSMEKEFADFPKYKTMYLNLMKKIIEKHKEAGDPLRNFDTPEEFMDWWINGANRQIKGQMSIEDWMKG